MSTLSKTPEMYSTTRQILTSMPLVGSSYSRLPRVLFSSDLSTKYHQTILVFSFMVFSMHLAAEHVRKTEFKFRKVNSAHRAAILFLFTTRLLLHKVPLLNTLVHWFHTSWRVAVNVENVLTRDEPASSRSSACDRQICDFTRHLSFVFASSEVVRNKSS
ncbi:hypothetical protein CcCBS67573_g07531 [Chytriomyces confervae]|uniref:Uncharacterized protein n=1 Tax=Chytriomyces confervae TaxID=246404 RepID=A0A507EVD0_9FUNG|nr:hypothetical protein CcCBS67573_g07531 [Chytriomyces confervae]